MTDLAVGGMDMISRHTRNAAQIGSPRSNGAVESAPLGSLAFEPTSKGVTKRSRHGACSICNEAPAPIRLPPIIVEDIGLHPPRHRHTCGYPAVLDLLHIELHGNWRNAGIGLP